MSDTKEVNAVNNPAPTYRLEAGRLVMRDNKPFAYLATATVPAEEKPSPTDLDTFARDVVQAMNGFTSLVNTPSTYTVERFPDGSANLVHGDEKIAICTSALNAEVLAYACNAQIKAITLQRRGGVLPTDPNRRPLYSVIAGKLGGMANCDRSGNVEWRMKHQRAIVDLVKQYLPSGGGFDDGTNIDFEKSKPDRLVFDTSFHHMDDSGYTGWTTHTVIVTPSLAYGIDIRVTGQDRNDIKDYIGGVFHDANQWHVAP